MNTTQKHSRHHQSHHGAEANHDARPNHGHGRNSDSDHFRRTTVNKKGEASRDHRKVLHSMKHGALKRHSRANERRYSKHHAGELHAD